MQNAVVADVLVAAVEGTDARRSFRITLAHFGTVRIGTEGNPVGLERLAMVEQRQRARILGDHDFVGVGIGGKGGRGAERAAGEEGAENREQEDPPDRHCKTNFPFISGAGTRLGTLDDSLGRGLGC